MSYKIICLVFNISIFILLGIIFFRSEIVFQNKNKNNTFKVVIFFYELIIVLLSIINFLNLNFIFIILQILIIIFSFCIVIIYMYLQQKLIYIDTLTGINNRNRAKSYINKKLLEEKKSKKIFFMIDLDDFKLINDNFGHNEGDEALKITSDVLKDICYKRGIFIARLGGDEFCAFVSANDDFKIDEFIESLRDKALEKCLLLKKTYKIRFSIGYSIYSSECKTVRELIEVADKMMYENKNQRKNNF